MRSFGFAGFAVLCRRILDDGKPEYGVHNTHHTEHIENALPAKSRNQDTRNRQAQNHADRDAAQRQGDRTGALLTGYPLAEQVVDRWKRGGFAQAHGNARKNQRREADRRGNGGNDGEGGPHQQGNPQRQAAAKSVGHPA